MKDKKVNSMKYMQNKILYSIIVHMKVTGIIAEYNPFHNGHIHHIKETKKLTNPDVLVCVMSGNFVQRGEPAIIDKWERAKIAVENGVDIVLELPYIYATQSAQYFAKGSVEILKSVNIDSLVFGSESNNIEVLKDMAKLNMEDISNYTKDGLSSVKGYEQVYGSLLSNDILGLNYIKALKDTNINAFCIQRTNHYHEKTMNVLHSSATSIRNAVYKNKDISTQTPMKHLNDTFKMEYYYPLIKMMLLTTPKTTLSSYFMMDEGIEGLLIKNAKSAQSYDEFLSLSVSKRYTKSRIQRTLIHMLTQTTKEDVNYLPKLNYIRVLAYNEKGKDYLKQLKKQEVTIASRFNQIAEPYRSMELKAAHVYAYPLSIEEQNKWLKKELQPPLFISTIKDNDINK